VEAGKSREMGAGERRGRTKPGSSVGPTCFRARELFLPRVESEADEVDGTKKRLTKFGQTSPRESIRDLVEVDQTLSRNPQIATVRSSLLK
jgi:hypothetical protein